MAKNRAFNLHTFVNQNKMASWLSREGYRLLFKAYRALSQVERDTLSDCLELDIPIGSRSKEWRNLMRLIMWLNMLLDNGATPQTIVAAAALRRYGGQRELTTDVRTLVDRYVTRENKAAVDMLAIAATKVRISYGADLDTAYATGMSATFETSTQPICFRWHNCAMTDAAWTGHLAKLVGSGANTDGKTGETESGLTMTWLDAKDVDLGNLTAPYNRCIEFPQVEEGALIHEMLHWCTHETFRTTAGVIPDTNERRLIKEGTTEFLKREATKLDHGGYNDIMAKYRPLIAALDLNDVKKAYFKGQKVQAVIDAMLLEWKVQEKARCDAADASEDRFRRLNLKQTLMRIKTPQTATASQKDEVFRYFKGLSDEAIRAEAPSKPWADYIIGRKATG